MVRISIALALITAAAPAAISKPLDRRYDYALKEVHNPPRQWRRVRPAPSDVVLNLHIGLKLGNWEALERNLFEVSDPSHERYGQHLTADEVNKLARPHDQTLEAVNDWLSAHGYDGQKVAFSPARDWAKLSIPVSEAERLLNTKYSVYKHEDGTEVIRTPDWSLPVDLHQHIVAVQPTNSFLRAAPRRVMSRPAGPPGVSLMDMPEIPERKAMYVTSPYTSNTTNEAPMEGDLQEVCNTQAVTPKCLRTLYKTIDYVPKAGSKVSVGFTNYLNETSMGKDLETFLKRYRPDAAGATVDFTMVNEGQNFQTLNAAQTAKQLNAEGNLDGQTLVSMVHPMKVFAYNTGGSPPFIPDEFTKTNTNEPYLEWLDYMLADNRTLPQVISTSYGDDEQTVPRDYAITVCQRMAMLGNRGITLLFASGDNGVGKDKTCISNDGKDTAMFVPSFPDSCPYVTSVGGTKNFNPEVVAYDPNNDFAPGGGYSNYFARPDYQTAAVQQYTTSLGDTYKTMYNATGRAYPDLAAQGQSYSIVWNDRNIQLDGTSASTPAIAGVIALLNDYLVSNGKQPLGFMNPWLYSVGYKGFNDILSGSAKGCETAGFPAKEGWDAVTGFGTPVRRPAF
jgi:tripeptidyl-peptidase-1